MARAQSFRKSGFVNANASVCVYHSDEFGHQEAVEMLSGLLAPLNVKVGP
jgi:hypothetical protein